MKIENVNLEKLLAEQQRLSSQIVMSIKVITPELAKKYLEKNLFKKGKKNRVPHTPTLNNYSNDMENGRWRVGAPIIFDITGAMIDGQTRCLAVIKANKPILSLVLENVDEEVFDSLDCGKKRTPKNVLQTLNKNGERLEKPAIVSAAISIMRSLAKNHTAIDKNRGLLTNPELFEMVYNDFDFYNEPFLAHKTLKWRNSISKAIPESIFAAFYFTHKKEHGDFVDEFLTTITSNDNNTPAIVREFRDLVLENKGKRSDERGYLQLYKIYLLIDALFKYSFEKGGLNSRKHFSKADVQEIINA